MRQLIQLNINHCNVPEYNFSGQLVLGTLHSIIHFHFFNNVAGAGDIIEVYKNIMRGEDSLELSDSNFLLELYSTPGIVDIMQTIDDNAFDVLTSDNFFHDLLADTDIVEEEFQEHFQETAESYGRTRRP